MSIEDWIRATKYNDDSMVRESAEELVSRLPLHELLTGFYKGTIEIATRPKPDPDKEPPSYDPRGRLDDHYALWEDMMPLLCTTIAQRIEGKST